MSNIQFFYNNLFDDATLTESSEADGFPAENTQDPHLGKVWTTEGATAGTANLVIDHGTATSVTAVILAGYDWAAAPGTLDIEFHATDAWGAPDATEAISWAATPDTYGNRNVIVKTFAAKSYRYNRLNVVNAPGDWSLGRIFIGNYFEPTRTYLHDYDENIVDESYITRSVGGQEFVDEIDKFRTKNVSFMTDAIAQFLTFQKVFNEVGYSKDLLISFDPDNYLNAQTMYGKLTNFSHTKTGLYNIDIGFKESR